jgi:hypothetical protein
LQHGSAPEGGIRGKEIHHTGSDGVDVRMGRGRQLELASEPGTEP